MWFWGKKKREEVKRKQEEVRRLEVYGTSNANLRDPAFYVPDIAAPSAPVSSDVSCHSGSDASSSSASDSSSSSSSSCD